MGFLKKILGGGGQKEKPGIDVEAAVEGALKAAEEARITERWAAAREQVDKALALKPDDLEALSESYVVSIAEGKREEAAGTAHKLLVRYVAEEEVEMAETLLKDCAANLPGVMPPELVAAGKTFLEGQGKPELAWRFAARANDKPVTAPTRLMDLYKEGEAKLTAGDRDGAALLFQQALAHSGCTDEWRGRIENAIARTRHRKWIDGEGG